MTFHLSNTDTWYINLDHRLDRRALIEDQLNRFHLQYRRLSAFTQDEFAWGHPAAFPKMNNTPATFGQWMSMTSLMRMYRDSERDLLILEDDAILAPCFRDAMSYLTANLPEDWDLVFLCGTFHVNPPVWHAHDLGRDVERTSAKHLFRAYGVWSNHAVLVHGKQAGHIYEAMHTVMHKSTGSDHALIQLQPTLKAYVLVPGCVFQRDMISDIGRGEVTEFSRFLEMGPYVYQDYLDNFDPDQFDWHEADTGARQCST